LDEDAEESASDDDDDDDLYVPPIKVQLIYKEKIPHMLTARMRMRLGGEHQAAASNNQQHCNCPGWSQRCFQLGRIQSKRKAKV